MGSQKKKKNFAARLCGLLKGPVYSPDRRDTNQRSPSRMILIIDERSARVLTAAREPGKVSPPRARRNINSADNEMGKYRLPRTFNRNALERLSADLDGRVIESVRSRLNRYTRCAIRSFLLSWGLSAGRSAPLHGTIRPTVVPYPPCARAFHYSIKPAHAPARTSEWGRRACHSVCAGKSSGGVLYTALW